MEQATRKRAHLERILIVSGLQKCWKEHPATKYVLRPTLSHQMQNTVTVKTWLRQHIKRALPVLKNDISTRSKGKY